MMKNIALALPVVGAEDFVVMRFESTLFEAIQNKLEALKQGDSCLYYVKHVEHIRNQDLMNIPIEKSAVFGRPEQPLGYIVEYEQEILDDYVNNLRQDAHATCDEAAVHICGDHSLRIFSLFHDFTTRSAFVPLQSVLLAYKHLQHTSHSNEPPC